MIDIYAGIAIMIIVAGLFFAFTFIVSSKFPRRTADFLAILTMIAMCLYIYYLWDKAEVTWLVPYSNAIIVGNWFPIITAVLSALVYHRIPKEASRKYWLVALLNLVGLYSMVQPVLGSPPHCDNVTDDFKMARQTSQVTCSPTSGVNLLKRYDIESTESEMAELCLTRRNRSWLGLQLAEGGTSWMGLYRGLKLKLDGTRWEPRFLTVSYEKFMEFPPENPLIVSLKLDVKLEQQNPDLYRILSDGGWQPGVEHNVVYLGLSQEKVAIIDPKIGYEEMHQTEFEALWVGRGIYLENH